MRSNRSEDTHLLPVFFSIPSLIRKSGNDRQDERRLRSVGHDGVDQDADRQSEPANTHAHHHRDAFLAVTESNSRKSLKRPCFPQ